MGAPKQKWTAEEESALKAGVVKHGSGNWRTILRDPEFCGILYLRSNVDLKDKWRNMRVTANGCGSREKARIALKKSRIVPKHDDNPLALSTDVVYADDDLIDPKLLESSSGILQITGPKTYVSKMEDLIIEAITSLKEPKGSNKTAIATYIEDQYMTPADFKLLLSVKLKAMTSGSGKLIKVKRKYRIAPSPAMMEGRKSKVAHFEVKQKGTPKEDRDDKSLTKFQVDAELAWMRNMTAQEAAAAAAQAIAEAEKAMAEAEEATREAEAAEADAEAAQAFAEAAMLTLKSRNTTKLMIRA
ncbi:Telomere repeat-binding factor 1 [Platanthera guangdongensis]|uniref:Telomere repeat-binding factor 1 n=1 Tax=Platanthera guangdongensis TaxID=2320717 RepID=A0ABR2LHU0_9ASPA